MSTNSFETWAANELQKGLVDIKFAVIPGKGINIEAVQEELIASEALISAGSLRANKPRATSMIPQHIQDIISTTTC